ncbi:MAG TPA: hypothetical protein VD860_11085 [Azospirillum sp.]|nr:hypothetical protein [Azospirillum sp.]
MRALLRFIGVLVAATAIAITPVSGAWAQESSGPPKEVVTAWGCVLFGTAGTAGAVAANSENLINVLAGGIVAPANPAILYIGLAGVVFTTFCTMGMQLTPLYLHYFHEDPAANETVAWAIGNEE